MLFCAKIFIRSQGLSKVSRYITTIKHELPTVLCHAMPQKRFYKKFVFTILVFFVNHTTGPYVVHLTKDPYTFNYKKQLIHMLTGF